MPFLKTICLAIFLSIAFSCYSQNEQITGINQVASSTIAKLRSAERRKIFLQTDRNIYAAGEKIYFKAWLVNAVNDKLVSKPGILYADLVDSKDSLITQLFFHAEQLKTNGVITLDNSIPTGYYRLRAYTNEMAEKDISHIAVASLYIMNPYNGNVSVSVPKAGTISRDATESIVECFPEGGTIMSGINSTVAIKATYKGGTPLITSGLIKDNHKKVIANFATNNYGLAKITFNPDRYSKYVIYLQNKDQLDSVGVLPAFNFFAAQLAVTDQDKDFIKARIVLEDSLFSKNYKTYLLGINRDSVCFASIGKGMYQINIPVSNFPGGISALLLYNEAGELLSERDVYINRNNYNLSINTDKSSYNARENVKLDIAVSDENAKPLLSSMTVAVLDNRIENEKAANGQDSLDNYSASDADLFMLSQNGVYKKISKINEAYNSLPSPEKTDSIFFVKGRLMNGKKEPAPDNVVTLISNSTVPVVFYTDTSDANGKFSFHLPDFNDSTQFNIQETSLRGNKLDDNIFLDAVHAPHFATPSALTEKIRQNETQLAQEIITYHIDTFILNSNREWLKPVTVTAIRQKVSSEDEKRSANFFANMITGEQLREQGMNNVNDAVLTLHGVTLNHGFVIIGGINDQYGVSPNDEPMLLVDGVQIALQSDLDNTSPLLSFLRTLNIREIDYIQALTGPEAAMYGVRGGNGVILIKTTTQSQLKEGKPGFTTFYPKGYHMAPSFIMPDYTRKEIKNSKTPDLRTTIYWNGNIITGADGKASINFFTADLPATYDIIVTGITQKGDYIHKTITINRK